MYKRKEICEKRSRQGTSHTEKAIIIAITNRLGIARAPRPRFLRIMSFLLVRRQVKIREMAAWVVIELGRRPKQEVEVGKRSYIASAIPNAAPKTKDEKHIKKPGK